MRKYLFFFFITILSTTVYSQKSPTELAQPIVDEGIRLYKSEMASWYGTDIFIANYKHRDSIGGYLSYVEGEVATCIFFSKGDSPRVLGAVSFDSTYQLEKAKLDLSERRLTANETALYQIRKIALAQVNSDTLFKMYTNTSLNLIPVINGSERKVYILTGPKESGVVIIGNDYLLTFDNDNKLVSKKQLHKNIIPIRYGGKELEGKEVQGAAHSHLPETGDFITATDICTLMLYSKYAKWKTHNVISEKYLNIWDCQQNRLTVITREALDRIQKDQKERHK